MMRVGGSAFLVTIVLASACARARADEPVPNPSSIEPPTGASSVAPAMSPPPTGLIPLVPGRAEHPYRLAPGPRPYLHRLAVSPGYGQLGKSRLFALRFAYSPNRWLGYEAEIAHAPGRSAHSLLHTLSILVRRPIPGRVQPYLIGGYGMILVFPSHAENADSVTRNLLTGGFGFELYIRDDLALRTEWKRTAALSGGRPGRDPLTYDYAEGTVGLSFQRRLGG